LIEASTGGHLWAERYDGDLNDIFGLQDEITFRVAAAILPTLETIERDRAARKPTETLGAWENYHRGLFHLYKLKRPENEAARQFFQRAVEAETGFALAHSALALTFFWEGWIFNVETRPAMVPVGVEHARKSIELDAREATGHLALAFGLTMLGYTDDAFQSVESALSLNPNYAWAHGMRGATGAFSGRWPEALASIATAFRLSPFDPMNWAWLHWQSRSQYLSGDYAAALTTGKALCQLRPDIRFGYGAAICALGQLGNIDEAQSIISDALARFGEPFRHAVRARVPELRPQDFQHLIEGYDKAGLK
jgi:tetratricopeptide (TPR) repeat protein